MISLLVVSTFTFVASALLVSDDFIMVFFVFLVIFLFSTRLHCCLLWSQIGLSNAYVSNSYIFLLYHSCVRCRNLTLVVLIRISRSHRLEFLLHLLDVKLIDSVNALQNIVLFYLQKHVFAASEPNHLFISILLKHCLDSWHILLDVQSLLNILLKQHLILWWLVHNFRSLQILNLLIKWVKLKLQLQFLLTKLSFLIFKFKELLLSKKYWVIKDVHSKLTRMIEERIVNDLRPHTSLQKKLPTECQNDVPLWTIRGNGFSYVFYGVCYYNI